jgi:signal transduction histidine kinase
MNRSFRGSMKTPSSARVEAGQASGAAAPPAVSTGAARFTQRERMTVLAIWTGLGLAESAKAWISTRLAGQPLGWQTVLLGNMPWWLMWAGLTPPTIALARRLRPDAGWPAFAAGHATAAALLSIVHHVIVGALYYYTRTRGTVLPMGGRLVEMTLVRQFSNFFALYFTLNLLTYFAIVAAYYGLEYYKRYRAGELRAARLEAGMQRARLEALRMELNPHFLFNTLNAVAGLVRRNEGSQAVNMLARLSELLRTTLEEGDDPEVPLDRELELLRNYLDIERIRFGDRLKVEVTADPTARTALVPPLILQPLVENAVRHGVAKHSGRGHIEVRASSRDGVLELSVVNTGPPALAFASVSDPERSGIGLANTRQRLAELYGAQGSLTFEALTGGGARAVIRLPLRSGSDDDAVVIAHAPDC